MDGWWSGHWGPENQQLHLEVDRRKEAGREEKGEAEAEEVIKRRRRFRSRSWVARGLGPLTSKRDRNFHLWSLTHANSSSLCKDLFGQPHVQKAGSGSGILPTLISELDAIRACAPWQYDLRSLASLL